MKKLIDDRGFELVNIDSQIVMQQPKLKPYIIDMRKKLAEVLDLELDRVSVKATTEEKLGFTGEEIGVKSYAVVLLREVKK